MPPNDGRGPKKTLRLTEREREFLKTGETGSYRTAALEKRVQEKVDNLPQRFETLFSDVELLDESGTLGVGTWSSGWSRLLGLPDEPTTEEMAEAFSFSRSEENIYPSSNPAELGRRLGRMFDRLLLRPEGADLDAIRHDLIWGFALGIYLDRRPAGEMTVDDRKHRMSEVAEMLEERAEEALELDEEVRESIVEGMSRREQWREMREEAIEHVADVLESEALVIDQKEHLGEHLPGDGGIDLDSLATKVVDYWVDSQVDDGRPGTHGQWSTFIDEHDPDVFDAEGVLTPERVRQIVDDHRLVGRVQLHELLRQDATRVRGQEYKRVPKEPVLLAVFRTPGVSSSEIHDKMNGEGHLSGVTRIARDFAGDGGQRQTDTGDVWNERPLLRGDKSGWSTTAYGDALGHYLSNTPRGSDREIPDDAEVIEVKQLMAMSATVPEDAVTAALDELRD